MSDSLQLYGLYPDRFLCPLDSPGKDTAVCCYPLLQGNLPDPGIEPTSPAATALQADYFTAEPLGNPQTERVFYINYMYLNKSERKNIVVNPQINGYVWCLLALKFQHFIKYYKLPSGKKKKGANIILQQLINYTHSHIHTHTMEYISISLLSKNREITQYPRPKDGERGAV